MSSSLATCHLNGRHAQCVEEEHRMMSMLNHVICEGAGMIRKLAVTAFAALAPLMVSAQIATDGAVGQATTISGPELRIPAALGQRTGGNLFHSFAIFNVPSGGSAVFEGDAALTAVIGRVTGGEVSKINGLLASEAPNADLFLLNPAGVIFGAEAELDLPGSLYLSSADFLRFSDGSKFSADDPRPIFTSAPPEAFGFLSNNNGMIALNSPELELEDGATFSASAAEIIITAGDEPVLSIEGGTVHLTAIASDGDVAISDASTSASLGLLQLIGLGEDDEEIDEEDDDGPDEPDPQLDVSGNDAGEVVLRAGTLRISDFSISADVEGDDAGQRTAISLLATNDIVITGESQISSIASGDGRAGDVVIRAGRLVMRDDAELLSDVRGGGAGGAVDIEANAVLLSGDAEIAADVDEDASGRGGEVRIRAGRFEISDEAEISSDTSGGGPGGAVSIVAAESILIANEGGIFSDARAGGDAGDILIQAPLIVMRGGIVSSGASAEGNGGDARVTASRELLLTENALITAASTGPAAAGSLFIEADALRLDRSRLETTSAAAAGGLIFIRGGTVLDLFRSSISTSVASGVGDGGNVSIGVENLVLDRGTISANAVGGSGGDVVVQADALFIGVNSRITATSELSVDGDIRIDAPEANLSGSLTDLETELVDISDLLRERCAARAPDQTGTLSTAGASNLPVSPLTIMGLGFHGSDSAQTLDAGGAFAVIGCGG